MLHITQYTIYTEAERPISYWIISKLWRQNKHIILKKPGVFCRTAFILAWHIFLFGSFFKKILILSLKSWFRALNDLIHDVGHPVHDIMFCLNFFYRKSWNKWVETCFHKLKKLLYAVSFKINFNLLMIIYIPLMIRIKNIALSFNFNNLFWLRGVSTS